MILLWNRSKMIDLEALWWVLVILCLGVLLDQLQILWIRIKGLFWPLDLSFLLSLKMVRIFREKNCMIRSFLSFGILKNLGLLLHLRLLKGLYFQEKKKRLGWLFILVRKFSKIWILDSSLVSLIQWSFQWGLIVVDKFLRF